MVQVGHFASQDPRRSQQQERTLIRPHSNDWQPHSSLFTKAHARGFVSESGVVFKHVQRVSREMEPLNLQELHKSSRKYRSVIHSWFLKVSTPEELTPAGAVVVTEESDSDDLKELSGALQKLEIAWHLCEILFIDIRSPGAFLVQLLQWVKWHFTEYVQVAERVISEEMPQMAEYYWDVILFYALRGEMENAVLFLELHSEAHTDPAFILVRDLLAKFPTLSSNQAQHEFYIRWELWHEAVYAAVAEQKIPSNSKRSHVQLSLLLRLLNGEFEAFQSVPHLFGSWYQMMVSYLLFNDPCMKASKFDALCDQFINGYYAAFDAASLEVDPFDELIRSAFGYNLMDVIGRASVCFNDNWWFVTHFVDLIYNSSQFKDYQIADIVQIRDAFVTDYADSLFSRRKQFWQLAIEYLVNVRDSEDRILLCLERMPFDSEPELQTLVSLARRFNFVELELSLYKIYSRQWLARATANAANRAKYGSALFWAVRSKDKMLINYIVEQYLRHYLKTAVEQVTQTGKLAVDGELLDREMVANLGSHLVLSDRLIFLGKYHEFHQLKGAAQYEPAAVILVDMLASNAIPEFFTFQVILDCLPLLESATVVLSSEQTCKILAALEEILRKFAGDDGGEERGRSSVWSEAKSSTSSNSSSSSNSSAITSTDDEMRQLRAFQRNIIHKYENTLRVAIARNLSRNFCSSSGGGGGGGGGGGSLMISGRV